MFRFLLKYLASENYVSRDELETLKGQLKSLRKEFDEFEDSQTRWNGRWQKRIQRAQDSDEPKPPYESPTVTPIDGQAGAEAFFRAQRGRS